MEQAIGIVAVGVVFGVVALGIGLLVSLMRSQSILKDIHKDYADVINNAMIHLKAQSVQEAVEAKTLEKEADVRVEMLKDALAQEPVAEVDEPKFVHTDDGRTIDLRDYELV